MIYPNARKSESVFLEEVDDDYCKMIDEIVLFNEDEIYLREGDDKMKKTIKYYDIYILDKNGDLLEKVGDVKGVSREDASFNGNVHIILANKGLTPSKAIIKYIKKFEVEVDDN